MISKVIVGKSFKGLCEYLCKDQARALVIGSEGVRDYDYRLMALDFERQRGLNSNLKSPALHIILSYYPGETISDEKMVQIAKEYMEGVGIENTQFAIVKHSDRNHPHTHLIINRVGNNGRTIKDSFLGLRGKKMSQHLTSKYGLIPADKKNLERTNLEQLNEYEATRYKIYEAIQSTLPKCKSLDDLKLRLKKQKIELLYKFKSQTNMVQGVSFQVGNFKYKGSEIDRQFSVRNLEKSILENLSPNQEKNRSQILSEALSESMDRSLGNLSSLSISLLEEMLRTEHIDNYLPHELMKKKRKRKGKSSRL
jgi:hypothetical protein